ncbi:amidase [Salinarimonas ramus]|uniref:Indoleacetamide hydrolase n=1 Tax=Salinarimonas ramus TaxID=690164 RepID=A0A917Q564_9HYPH|nr:amidase [Salinarimonas ramus]GGK26335.1 amidase [Salinarimonas ramus]
MTVRDRLESVLSRLEARAAEERVYTRIYAQAARAAADAADARRRVGVSLGPLDGALVSIKDLFDVAGEPTTAGSKILRDASSADADAPVVARLRRAGAVIVGKTNMSEFAFSGIGINPHWGTPGNAADPARVPGGSSSGAGVSVGEGTCDIAIGTDTGGSVRIPASLNGVVGFKPTASRVPTRGAYPLSRTLDSIGPLARTVAHCAAADAVMAGEEPSTLDAMPVAGLRIGVPRGLLFTQTEDVVAHAFEATLERLAAAGARIVEHPIDDLLEAMNEAATRAGAPLVAIEAAAVHAQMHEPHAAGYDQNVLARIRLGAGIGAAPYQAYLATREALVAAMDRRLAPLDVLALPSTATTAPPIATLEADSDAFRAANILMLRNTSMGNLFDLTGISLPMPGMARPAGLMLMKRRGHDRTLLEVAAGIEAALGC